MAKTRAAAIAALLGLGWLAGPAGAGSLSLMSKAAFAPPVAHEAGNAASLEPAAPASPASADGRYAVFLSTATNLIPGQVDTAGTNDVFLRDRVAGTTALVSHTAASAVTAAGGADLPSISADGRYVVYASTATSLVTSQTDTNSALDVFLYDRTTGANLLVSHNTAASTTAANGASDLPAIDAAGTAVVWRSKGTNLVVGQTDSNAATDIFLFDVAAGTTTLVSRNATSAVATANGAGDTSVITADGRFVAYLSRGTNVIAGQVDTNSGTDVFLYDRVTLSTVLVSRRSTSAVSTANGASDQPSVSADGAWIAFRSAGINLGATDASTDTDIWLYSRASGTNLLVSRRAAAPTQAANGSTTPVISADGGSIAYVSSARDLVSGQVDANSFLDVFLFQRALLTNALVSRSTASATTVANANSTAPSISADGAWVAFLSDATNLVAGQGDANNAQSTRADVFVYERATQANALASRSTSAAATTANRSADRATISGDGAFVVYSGAATDVVSGLTDANSATDAFAFDRAAGTNLALSRRYFGPPPATGAGDSKIAGPNAGPSTVSGDGRYAVFSSYAANLVAGGTDANGTEDVFLYDRDTATLLLVSRADGTLATAGNGRSYSPTISQDGLTVAFVSNANNLLAGFVPNGTSDQVYLWDRASGAITLVSHAAGSPLAATDTSSRGPVLSADGQSAVFFAVNSNTNLVAGLSDTNGADDVFLFDRATGTVTLVSAAAGSPTTTANGRSYDARLSADGGWVTFVSLATNLLAGVTDTNATTDIYLWQRATGNQSLVTHTAASATTTGSSWSFHPELSADGRWVVFGSSSYNLVTGQVETSTSNDLFLYDRTTGASRLVSHVPGSPAVVADGTSEDAVMSLDGRFVAFPSYASNLVPNDTNGSTDVVLWDRDTDTFTLASRATGTPVTSANSFSSYAAISGDGRFVAFLSQATNLIAGQVDPLSNSDVFLFDRLAGTVELVSHDLTSPVTAGNGTSGASTPRMSLAFDGSSLAFSTSSSNLVAGDTNGFWDSFLFEPDRADLGVTLTDSVDPVASGNGFDLTAAVTNLGPGAASAVTLAVTLPAGSTFLAATGTGWSCGETGDVVTCTASTLAVGAAPPVTISLYAPAGPVTASSTATVAALTLDPAPANQSATETTGVTP